MSFVTEQFAKSLRRKDTKKWNKYKYNRLDDNDKYKDDAAKELIELADTSHGSSSRRGKFSKTKQESTHCVEHTIKEGDTLQKLSLLYGCPIAELKRVNRLIGSQELYALNTVLIPVKQYSVLTETLPIAGCSSKVNENNDEQVRTFHLGISQVLNGEKKSEATAFLNKMDEDLARIRNSTKNYKDSLEEVAEILTLPQFKPLIENEKKRLLRSGADCGLQWKSLICIVIIFIFVLPIISVIYLRAIKSLPVGNYSEPKTN